MAMPCANIAIVNYRTGGLVVNCLVSLAEERRRFEDLAVTVVDNASPDDSVAVLRRAIDVDDWGDWVTVLPLKTNGGFAYGNNRAIEHVGVASPDTKYFMLLNPDTLVERGAIERLVAFAEAHPNAGIVGSRLLGPDGTVQSSAKRFPAGLNSFESAARTGPISRLLKNRLISMPPRDDPHQCDWVSGAAMLIRREVVERIGLMDEGYFLYFEEVDYCRRAKEAGFEVWHEPASVITHLEGAATGIGQPKRRPRWWFESRRRFFVKAYGPRGLIWVDACWFAGRCIFLLRDLFRNPPQRRRDPKRFTSDVLIGDLIAFLTGRVFRVSRK